MLKIYSETKELGDLGRQLNHVAGSLNNPQPLMLNIAQILETSTRDRFTTKIAPDGSRWADWSPSTKRMKKYQKRGQERLMRDSSRLLRSITRHATANMAQVGTNLEYAPYHQTGTRKMVARPMFGISAQDRLDILDELQKFVQESWGN